MATLVTAASVRKVASSLTPRLVVGNLFLVTTTSPPGSLTRVAATTLSRCTSRPAALSACCFMSPPLLVQPHAPALAAGRGPRWKRNLGFVLVATLVGPHGPAPDFVRARGCKKIAATTPLRPPSGFHPSWVAAPVIPTLSIFCGSTTEYAQ